MGWLSNLAGTFTGSNQRKAANQAAEQLNASKKEAYGFLDPYTNAGQSALSPLQALISGTDSSGNQLSSEQRNAIFYQNPGYQFSLDQALKGVQASQAARGNLLSGGAQKEIAQYASGAASQYYNDYLNQLFQFAQMGENAATAKANVATGTGSQLSQAAFSNGIAGDVASSRLLQLGGSLAGAYSGSQGSGSGGKTSGGGGGVVNMLPFLTAESDISLKENIEFIKNSPSGIPIYHFEYKDKKFGEGKFEGTMAQDLEKIIPEAVFDSGKGYKMVNYSLTDIEFKRVQ